MKRCLIICLIISSCCFNCFMNKNISKKFIKNVNENDICLFQNNHIMPERSNYYSINNYRFDEISMTLSETFMIPDSLRYLSYDTNEKEELIELFKKFKELNIVGISGMCRYNGYIKIIISNKDIVVYICDKLKFNLQEYCKSYTIDIKSIHYNNDKWFYYTLPKDRYIYFN